MRDSQYYWQEIFKRYPSAFSEFNKDIIFRKNPDGLRLHLTIWRVFTWKAVEKDEIYDFKQIQDDFNFILNNDIKGYFNSYWFLELAGKYKNYSIILEPVIPGVGLRDFSFKLEEYFKSHNNQLNYIPIGFEANGLLIVMNNEIGKVYIEDHEKESYEEIANSIEELISYL